MAARLSSTSHSVKARTRGLSGIPSGRRPYRVGISAELDDRMLADIGLGHADVARETAKPFWQP